MLMWKNFDSFSNYIWNINSLLQKFHFPMEVVLDSLETQKDLELVCRSQLLQKLLIKCFLLYYDINWPNFINRMGLLSELFSKIYSLFQVLGICWRQIDELEILKNIPFAYISTYKIKLISARKNKYTKKLVCLQYVVM